MTKQHILSALNEEGKFVYIDEVCNGKNCKCICAECGGKLIAKQGNVKVHHFAHACGNDSIKCSQTALHLLAKKIISEEKKIPTIRNRDIEFVKVDTVEQEKNLGNIKPDLYAEYNKKPIAVEIFISHAVDEKKFDKIQDYKLTTFEINLSTSIYESKDDVKKAIYDKKNIKAVYDEFYTKQNLLSKKQFLNKEGKLKKIGNKTVYKCPMTPIKQNGQIQAGNIDVNICEMCPFGYKADNENYVHCTGHLYIEVFKALYIKQNTFLCSEWYFINVTKQKIVHPSELAEFFSLLTRRKFKVIKSRKKTT